VRRFCRIRM